jgi:acyl-CoA thioesterase-1
LSFWPFPLFFPARLEGSFPPLTGLLPGFSLSLAEAGGAAAARPLRILAFGDSLVAGFAVSSKAAFPVRLEKTLRGMGFAVELINAGVPGDTTAGGRARLEQALECGPDLVILELGANDNLQGFDPAVTESNLDAILARLTERNIAVLLAGIHPLRDLGEDYRAGLAAVFWRLAEKYQAVLYPDFLAGVAGRPEFNKADGIHPNPKGIDEIVRRLTPLVADLLQRVQGSLDRS